jgi:hypothetical protein
MGPDHSQRLAIDFELSNDYRDSDLPDMADLGPSKGNSAEERNTKVVVARAGS